MMHFYTIRNDQFVLFADVKTRKKISVRTTVYHYTMYATYGLEIMSGDGESLFVSNTVPWRNCSRAVHPCEKIVLISARLICCVSAS